MVDGNNVTSPFAVGQRVQFYISFFREQPNWFHDATVIKINPQTNNADETFDIANNFTVPAKSVRPFRGYGLNVGEICEYILSTDEDGNVTSTMPYTIISKYNDSILGEWFYLNFTQRGMRAEHLHVQPPESDPCINLLVAANLVAMIFIVSGNFLYY